MITGTRQVGKSTLCGLLKKELGFDYVSLDNPMERKMAREDPLMFIKLHPYPLIIDEIQYAPGLFEAIEYIVNQKKYETGYTYGMYILIGSHKYELMKDVTESLAGRVNIIEMSPLSMSEIYGVEETPFSVDLEKINERISSYKIQPDVLYNRIIRGMYPNSTTILKKIRRSSTAIM